MAKTIKKEIDIEKTEMTGNNNSCCQNSLLKGNILKLHLLGLILILLALGIFGYLFKEKFVVAIIDGRPVLRYELDQRLSKTFGKETLENIIIEKLISQEANKSGVVVSQSEIDKEIENVTKSLGEGVKLEDALKFQGLSIEEFKNQLQLRLQVNKLIEKQITISPEEVDAFVKENAKTLVATGEAEKKAEAESLIKEQKISSMIQGWVNDLLTKAKISRFLK